MRLPWGDCDLDRDFMRENHIMMTSRRILFEKIVKRYLAYLDLYVQLTGSTEGATPFNEFYWQFTFYSKYNNARELDFRGY